jgi:hypothetical protein
VQAVRKGEVTRKKPKLPQPEPFGVFALLHPDEAARFDWKKFRAFMKKLIPGIRVTEIRRELRKSAGK